MVYFARVGARSFPGGKLLTGAEEPLEPHYLFPRGVLDGYTERVSHYFAASLPGQFDAIIHLDETRAVEPLERGTTWRRGCRRAARGRGIRC